MVSALISAAVAFAVLIIAQWVIFWRERSRLLLGKLEDLYILLLDPGERNLTRFDRLMRSLATQDLPSAEVVAVVRGRTDLSFDQIMAADLLERISLLVDFYFPQLRRELEEIFEANRECISILHGTSVTGFLDYDQVNKIATAFADRKAVMEKRILTERPVLTKSFTGKVRAWFECD